MLMILIDVSWLRGLSRTQRICTIFLLNNNDVDSTAERCWVERVVGIPHRAKGVSHILHISTEKTVARAGRQISGGLLSGGILGVPAVVAAYVVVWSWARL